MTGSRCVPCHLCPGHGSGLPPSGTRFAPVRRC